ncbi:MAG: long-chain fatty acid--CoA ligase [Proteobacteria bacterium]|nr:MAG: long-chain fatty acid--CoA ligase [Pseudomonadota bacterium]
MTTKSVDWFPSLGPQGQAIALVDGDRTLSYEELQHSVNRVIAGLLDGEGSLNEERVAFLYPASFEYASLIIGIVAAGGIAVPLSVHASADELSHCLSVAGVKRLLLPDSLRSAGLDGVCEQLSVTQLSVDDLPAAAQPVMQPITAEQGALIVFTSGTTGKPKAVVHTVESVSAMVTSLIEAWGWVDSDVIPLFLPLHHVHGIVNILLCALWRGATVDLFARFDAKQVCEKVAAGQYSVFMAVPTIYVKLIAYLKTLDADEQKRITQGFTAMRLNVSGSAACPVPLFEEWEALTSQRFLERYGMTELGMALSNPYDGERRPGHVGQPLPGVLIKRVDERGDEVTDASTPGELAVKSPTAFREYWGNPESTAKAFADGWFLTGDIAVIDEGAYRILGRASIDIIKSGGYKLSALEIEATLLEHPYVNEVAVVGVPDDEWGELVACALVVSQPLSEEALTEWARERMSGYKVPRRWHFTEALPRNALGKVTKPSLKSWF